MTFGVPTSIKFSAIMLSLAAAFISFSQCNRNEDISNSSEDDSFFYSYTGTVELPETTGLNLAEKKITYHLSWNEDGKKIIGQYLDDYFVQTAIPIEGTINPDTSRLFLIVLPLDKDGISKLVITTEQLTGPLGETLSIAHISALNEDGIAVLEKSGLSATKNSKLAGATENSPSGEAGAFFSSVAGTYDYFANNTTGTGNGIKWTHGNKYKITIGADGSIAIPTNGETKTHIYNTSAGDSFERLDGEEYAFLKLADGATVLVQRETELSEFRITHQVSGGAFWIFQNGDPGPAPTVLSNRDIGYAVGTHKHKITYVSGEGATDYKKGDPVEITINSDGSVIGTFGAFTYSKTETAIGVGTKNDKPSGSIKYYRPDEKTFPRWYLDLRFYDQAWTSATLVYETQSNSSVGRKSYFVVVDQ